MTVTPQGKIKLCTTPLTNDYAHSITWTNKQAQTNYFNNLSGFTDSEYTYIKKDNVVRINKNIDSLINYNYLTYTNVGFTNKTYYCFITNMEYLNEDCTAVTFETDVLQTYYFDIIYKKSFIEREHVNNDTFGLHTIPEQLETGEYIDIPNTTSEEIAFASIFSKYYVCCAVTQVDFATDKTIYGGVPSGLIYLVFKNISDFRGYLSSLSNTEVLYGVFLIPSDMVPTIEFSEIVTGIEMASMPTSFTSEILKSYTLTDNKKLDNGYTPRNNKLLCYPYRTLAISNNIGGNVEYHYELFKSLNGNISNPSFVVRGVPGFGCGIKLSPKYYNLGNGEIDHSTENNAFSLDCGKLPTCSWINDPFTNWLTQNAVNIGLSLATDTAQIITGTKINTTEFKHGSVEEINPSGTISGLIGIGNTLAQIYQHAIMPPSAKGGKNMGDYNFATGLSFTIYKKSIKEEYCKIIDNYFDMFGYKVNDFKIPQFNSRQNWNFIKCIDLNIEGAIPQGDIEIIKTAFNNGITWWHNVNNILDYSKPNNIVEGS